MSTLRTVLPAGSLDNSQLSENTFSTNRNKSATEFKESTRPTYYYRTAEESPLSNPDASSDIFFVQSGTRPTPPNPTARASDGTLQLDGKFIPQELRGQYENVLNAALNLNGMDKGADGKSGILKDIKQAKVSFVPVSNMNADPVKYLQDLGVKPEVIEQYRKMSRGFQGDAITLTLGTQKDKFHLTFIKASSFQSLSQLTTTVNHELAHVALIESGTQGSTRSSDEVKAHDKSIPSLQRIRTRLGELVAKQSQENVLNKLYRELKGHIEDEVKLRESWKAK